MVYALEADGVRRLPQRGAALDGVSLTLPEGVYTTLRTYGGNRIVSLSEHLQRLVDSLALVGRGAPAQPAQVRAGLRQVLAQAGLREARVRITVPFDGPAAFYSLEPFEPYPAEYYSLGVRLGTVALARETPRAKHTRAIGRALAARQAAEAPADAEAPHELIRVSPDGELLEGLSSNFFAVRGGVLYTAGAEVLPGITRKIVLSLAAGWLPVDFSPVRLSEAGALAEAFISSASREVMPAVRLNRRPLGAGTPGPVSRKLLARYRAYVADHAEVA
jgi:branched-chain amino acid aminotransferase